MNANSVSSVTGAFTHLRNQGKFSWCGYRCNSKSVHGTETAKDSLHEHSELSGSLE